MKRLITSLFLIIALLLSFSGCRNDGGDETSSSETETQTTDSETYTDPSLLHVLDFFPFSGDVHRKYRGLGNEFAEYDSFVDYSGENIMQMRVVNPGTTSVQVYRIDSGRLIQAYSAGETYFKWDFTGESNMEEVVMQEPLEKGNSWTLSDGSVRTITNTRASITVPYGTFDAVEITTERTDSTTRDYYVVGIGLVKSEFISDSDPENPISSELELIEWETPYSQTVRVYYPDFNNDRIVYVDKTAALHTNEEIAGILEESLKNIPAGSGLQAVIPADASLLSVRYDVSLQTVTVDFSSEFVSSMNAGAGLEGMILSSVADTFGYYFQTHQVSVTLEGGAYSSGHFYYEPGEFLETNWDAAMEYTP
ncbi:GerMN domain-containing protein [Parasporobacterium paucivorans]|uniref:Sporulation and spore germination n=1 Tax=Parasporobacterium paucivorans DSM 15970 TaxID=1122934 RepID=A0A1M6IK68_9FIRM|nr:GerMN domain-containing protein [Parasporobacterium paucivorans]SHJ34860.1 Sporulation and spore germination [Parasporobacterium paucivorans DSM 15970]